MTGKKIAPQLLGAALGAISVWAADAFAGVKIPAEIAVAIGTVISVLVSIATPDSMEAE